MITNIQLLRAAAALAVVFYHTGYLLGPGVHTDFQGVAVFFVISGFIIPRVGYKGSRHFLAHRFIRIVPIYWIATLADLSWFTFPWKARIVLLALCVAAAFVPEGLFKSRAAKRFGLLFLLAAAAFFVKGFLTLPDQTRWLMLKSFAFIPARDINGDLHPFLGPGWTLNMEVYFYALFALALSLRARLAPLLAALALVALPYFHKTGRWSGIYAEFYSNDYIRYFVYGMALYYVYGAAEKIPAALLRDKRIAALVGSASAGLAALFVLSAVRPHSFALPYGPVVLVAAALACHLVGLRVSAPGILLLGNASYVLYLFHIFFLETLRPVLKLDSFAGMAVALAVSAAGAAAIHRHGELPLLEFLRRRH